MMLFYRSAKDRASASIKCCVIIQQGTERQYQCVSVVIYIKSRKRGFKNLVIAIVDLNIIQIADRNLIAI